MMHGVMSEQTRIANLSLCDGQAIDLTLAGLPLKGNRLPSPSRNDDGLHVSRSRLPETSSDEHIELVKMAIRVGLMTVD